MNKIFKLIATICLVFISIVSYTQPAKNKPSKPITPVKKIDYAKLKTEIHTLYRDEKHAAVIKKATQYLLKFANDTAVTIQKSLSCIALKQYQPGFNLLRKFYTNIDTAAKYIAFIGFSVPEKDILTLGIVCADESIKMVPTGPYGYFVKGGIYSDAGDHKKALPFMEKMFALCRNDNEKIALSYFYPKELAFNKQHVNALTIINDLYLKYPKEKEIIFTYSIIYRLNELYAKAIEKYDELSALYPAELEYQSLKVSAYAAWGKTTEACAMAELLIAKDISYSFMRFRYKCPDYFAAPALKDIKTASWTVNANGSNYNFTVSNTTENEDGGLEFDWLMTSGTNMNGHIKITKDAMEKASAQNNYFGPDLKNATLTDKTTIWVSKAIFSELQTNGSAKMDVGNGEEVFSLITDKPNKRDAASFYNKVKIGGIEKFINTIHIKNADYSRQLWILNDVKNPMIVKMDIGFSISLKSID